MSREPKPSDVQVVLSMHPSRVQEFAMWLRNNSAHGSRAADYAEQIAAQRHGTRLAVIDPEDREQVERLADLFLDKFPRRDQPAAAIPEWSGALSMALREFADPKPPKCGATLVIGPQGAVYPCTKHEGHLEPHANEVYSWTGVTP